MPPPAATKREEAYLYDDKTQKTTILKMRAEGISYKAIAENLGMSLGSVRMFVSHHNQANDRCCEQCGQRLPERASTSKRRMPRARQPYPHIRSAHWHTYWTGPREAVFPEKKPVMRWIPPLPIGMNGRRELPTNIRMVK